MSIISTNGMYNIYAWQDNNRVFTVTTGEDNIKYLYLHLQDREGDIDLRDTTVQYAITKSNGSVSIEDAEIVVAGTGNIKVPITSALTNVAGFAQGEIRVITSDGVLKFYGVHLNVIQGASDENIENSQEFSILISALQKLTSVTTSGNVAALDTSITKDGVNPVASGVLYNYLYNNYVPQNRKIGGLNLTSDIAAEELGEELLEFFSIHKNEAPPVCSTATYFIGQRWIDTMRNDIYVLRTIVKNHYGEGIHNYQWEKIAKHSELSDYVQKTRTIAGLSLNNNITAEELKTALDVKGKIIIRSTLPPTNDLETVAEVGDFWLISKDQALYVCYGKQATENGYANYLWLSLTDYLKDDTTLAELRLENNITADELKGALGVSTIGTLFEPPTPNTVGEYRQLVCVGDNTKFTGLYLCLGKQTDDTYKWVEIAPSGNGADGKSAYEIAVANGFKGTETEWLESLKGADGRGGVANYTGKKILFMGDSIVRQSSATSGWVGIFNEIIKPASFVNTAVSGANWSEFSTTEYDGNPTSDNDANNVIGNQVEKIARGKDTTNANYSEVAEYADFDIIVIAAGINDYSIGADEPDIENSFTSNGAVVELPALDKKVFASAFRYCIETLRNLYPNAQIFVCTPTQTAPTYRTYSSVKGKRDHIIALCERMSVTCIDTFMCGIYSINENNGAEGLDLSDGVHPNDSGKSKIAKYNAREIIKHYIADTSDEPVSDYTNLVPTSVDATGAVFNGTGYQDNARINSSGVVSTSGATNTTCTGFIKVSGGDIVRIKNCDFLNSINGQNANAIGVYDSAKNHLGTTTVGGSAYGIFGSTYNAYNFSSVVEETTGVYKWVVPPTESGVEWVRLSCYTGANGVDLIVTVNEEIT